LFTRLSRSFVVLARFGNTQLSHVLWFGSNVLLRQLDLLLLGCTKSNWLVVPLGDSVAATIRPIATAITPSMPRRERVKL
jgi:hypothetical protein